MNERSASKPILRNVERAPEDFADGWSPDTEEIWELQSTDGKRRETFWFDNGSGIESWKAVDFHEFSVELLECVSRVSDGEEYQWIESETLGRSIRVTLPTPMPFFVKKTIELFEQSDHKSYWEIDSESPPPKFEHEASLSDAFLLGVIRGAIGDESLARRKATAVRNTIEISREEFVAALREESVKRPGKRRKTPCVRHASESLGFGKSKGADILRDQKIRDYEWMVADDGTFQW